MEKWELGKGGREAKKIGWINEVRPGEEGMVSAQKVGWAQSNDSRAEIKNSPNMQLNVPISTCSSTRH